MKKFSTVLIIVLFVAGVVLAFIAGDNMSNKAHMENRPEEFKKYISLAIDTVEDKGLAIEGATETIASNIWVAHELCDNAEISQNSATSGTLWFMRKIRMQVKRMFWQVI